MSDELKVGDIVTWWSNRRQEWQTGTLLQAPVRYHDEWPVTVRPDDTDAYRGIVAIRPERLTRVTPTQLVAGIAARPQDDAVRESAIAALVDDYEEVMAMMRNANSLGTVEL